MTKLLLCPSCRSTPTSQVAEGLSLVTCPSCGRLDGAANLETAMRNWNEAAVWIDIKYAKKDRTRYLLKLKPASDFPDHAKNWGNEVFVGLHSGLAEDGFDIGWSVSSPVGHGGFPDSWIEGFQEIAGVTELGPWEPWKDDEDAS